jgi:hypothetical protein
MYKQHMNELLKNCKKFLVTFENINPFVKNNMFTKTIPFFFSLNKFSHNDHLKIQLGPY